MNRKQFLAVLAVLVILIAAGAAVLWNDRTAWQKTDANVGQRLVAGLKLADIAEIRLQDSSGTLTLVKSEGEWRVRERADFYADVSRIGDMLLKLIEVKIVQNDSLPEGQRGRLQLQEPKGATNNNAGTILELKDAGAKPLARLLLGKKILKQTEGGPAAGTPSGRYVLSADGKSAFAVNDPLNLVEIKPEAWLAKDLLKIEKIKDISAQGSDGKLRWAVTRENENADWKFASSTEKPDNGKVQDVVSSLSSMNLDDVSLDAKEAGLDAPTTIKVDTFDGPNYTIRVGGRSGENRHFVAVSVSGDLVKTRKVGAGETAEQKKNLDREFEERSEKLQTRLKRAGTLDRWNFVVQKSSVDPLLRERAQLLPEKKPAAKKP